MNTKLIMTLSAAFCAAIGLSLTFLPAEIGAYIGVTFSKPFYIVFQILGALYFAFAMLNWMAKGATIGGIYNRPIAIANFAHFLMVGIVLIKGMLNNAGLPKIICILAGFYVIFTLVFWFITFKNPVNVKGTTAATV